MYSVKQKYVIGEITFNLNCNDSLELINLIQRCRSFVQNRSPGLPADFVTLPNGDAVRIYRITDKEYNSYYKTKDRI